MELYDTEEQQVEAIKDWWKENGKAVIVGTVIGLAAILGWNYYQDSKQATQEVASHEYTQVVDLLKNKGLAEEANAQSFIDTYRKSEYSVLAAMQLAKVQIEANHLDEGLAQLNWAKEHTTDDALGVLLSYRIARVQAEQGHYDQAISLLDSINNESWASRVQELKGDILLRKGDKEGAYVQYSQAQQSNDAGQSLQMKLDDLAK